MSNSNYIGKVLKDLIRESGKTQREVARLVYVSEGTMSNYVNDKTRPSPEMCLELCDIFEVSADYLLGRKDKIKQSFGLNAEETMLIECYRTTSPPMKRYLLQELLNLRKNFPMDRESGEKNK